MVNPKIAGIAGMFIWFIPPNMAKVYGKNMVLTHPHKNVSSQVG
jgi:hypothetical protein